MTFPDNRLSSSKFTSLLQLRKTLSCHQKLPFFQPFSNQRYLHKIRANQSNTLNLLLDHNPPHSESDQKKKQKKQQQGKLNIFSNQFWVTKDLLDSKHPSPKGKYYRKRSLFRSKIISQIFEVRQRQNLKKRQADLSLKRTMRFSLQSIVRTQL